MAAAAKVCPFCSRCVSALMAGATSAWSTASVASAPQALALVTEELPEGIVAVKAPMQGTVVAFDVQPGDEVFICKQVLVMDAMKMEHVVKADAAGIVQRLGVNEGDTVFEGHPLIYLEEADIAVADVQALLDQRLLDLKALRAFKIF